MSFKDLIGKKKSKKPEKPMMDKMPPMEPDEDDSGDSPHKGGFSISINLMHGKGKKK